MAALAPLPAWPPDDPPALPALPPVPPPRPPTALLPPSPPPRPPTASLPPWCRPSRRQRSVRSSGSRIRRCSYTARRPAAGAHTWRGRWSLSGQRGRRAPARTPRCRTVHRASDPRRRRSTRSDRRCIARSDRRHRPARPSPRRWSGSPGTRAARRRRPTGRGPAPSACRDSSARARRDSASALKRCWLRRSRRPRRSRRRSSSGRSPRRPWSCRAARGTTRRL